MKISDKEMMLSIAKGCLDYGGGYRREPDKYDAFQHGIKTVITALEKYCNNGLNDTQTVALYRIGKEEQ